MHMPLLTDAQAVRKGSGKGLALTPGQLVQAKITAVSPAWLDVTVQAGAALCCAALCCAVLCCAVLCCAVLCCAALRCAALCCAVLCCAVLCCAVLCWLLAMCQPSSSWNILCAVLCCAMLAASNVSTFEHLRLYCAVLHHAGIACTSCGHIPDNMHAVKACV